MMQQDGHVVVVGGGTMGSGIATSLAAKEVRVTVIETNAAVARAIQTNFAAGDLPSDSIPAVTQVWAIPPDTTLVIEAVPERVELKREVVSRIESLVDPQCTIATNTSSLSIDTISDSLEHPERFVGMHFFNPVPRSALVELVVGSSTAAETIAAAKGWIDLIGKEWIEVSDSPGFATSRLGLAIGLEAIRMVEERVASPEDIDKGMVLGYRFPMGPLKLTDLVGLDVRLAIAEHLSTTLGPRFEPPQLLRAKVEAGELGKKTGRGFYDWQ